MQSFIPTCYVNGIVTQLFRIDAVESRRLMQPDKGVRIIPVTTRLAMPVDHDNCGVRFCQQGINKGHTHRARTYHQIICLYRHC